MSIAAFYRRDRWGSRYGLVDAFHPTPHKGLDVAQNMPGVEVPAVEAGVVAATGKSSSVGNYITIRRDIGGYRTYAHVVPYKFAGQVRVSAGQGLGYQARTKAEGGSSWTGPHVHLCLSSTLTGWAYWSPVNVDPTPSLLVVLASTTPAGGGITPITPPAAAVSKGNRMSFSLIPVPELGGTVAASLITGLEVGLASPYHASTMLRFRENIGADNMLRGEIAFCRGYLALINPTPALLALDYSKISEAIKAAVGDAHDDSELGSQANANVEKILSAIAAIEVKGSIPASEVAAEVQKLLEGDFARVPAAVLDLQAKRLGNG